MFELAVLSLFVFLLFAYLSYAKKKKRKGIEAKKEENPLAIQTNYEEISLVQEEFPLSDKEFLVYTDHTFLDNGRLFEHTLNFIEQYVYPKKHFRRLLIEQIEIPNQSRIAIYTDTSDMYMITFNEQFRVIGYKKKPFKEPFLSHIHDKEKISFQLTEKIG